MAMMAKMRSLAPAFIIGVGALFVLFMVLSDSNVMEVFGARTNNIGSINGVDITYKEFTNAEQQQRENEKAKTGKDVADDNSEQFRDQVWDALVTQTLIAQEMKKFDVSVSDAEIRNIILGPNPPEFLKKYFIDSTGKFNRQLYQSALYDPQNAKGLLQAEDIIRQNRLNSKLQSLLLASVNVSEAEIRRAYIDQNIKMNTQYALFNLNEFPDNSINVSDNEIKDYYNNNLDQYGIKAQRKLKYVLFPNVPSSEDSSIVIRNLGTVKANMKTDTTSFKTLVGIYSSQPYKVDTLTVDAFTPEAVKAFDASKPGTVVGPIGTHEGYVLYKYLGSVSTNTTFVKASHILINQFGDDAKNEAEAMKIYNQLKSGADFATLAKEYSKDPGSAVKGGDLGWFGKGRMVPEFEKACFAGQVGEILKPVKTNFGYHIIKVTGKTNKKYIVAKIVNPVKPSPSTREDHLNTAKDFVYVANKDGFEKEGKLMDYKVQETSPFTKESYYIPGIGVSQKLNDWAFDNSLNDISEVFSVNNGYVVAQISQVISEGVKPLKDVKNQVKQEVLKEKKFELAKKKAAEVRSKINGDLTKVSSIDPKATVSQTGEFTGQGSIPNVGMDYNFKEESLSLKVGTLSEPIKGARGYYLLKVLSRTPFDSSAYAIQRNTIRDQLLQQKKSSFFSQWLSNLKKNADIVDNRRQFFGM